ncbi:TPA: hypothetical protein ACVU5P_004188 [Vibrio parahaemolyticus]
MNNEESVYRNTDQKASILKMLLCFVKQGYIDIPVTMLREALANAGIEPRADSLMRTLYTMENEGLVNTKRIFERPGSRKIVICVHLTKFGSDRACAAYASTITKLKEHEIIN